MIAGKRTNLCMLSNSSSLKMCHERKTILEGNIDVFNISHLFLICFLLFLLCLGDSSLFKSVSEENVCSGATQENASVFMVSFGPQTGSIFSSQQIMSFS